MVNNTYKFGHRIEKENEQDFGWENVEVQDIPLTKPIILCFGGNAVISDKFANGMAKTTEQFLGVSTKSKFVDIYSLRYAYENIELVDNNGNKVKEKIGVVSNEEIEEIAEQLFLSRVVNKNDKKLSVEQASKNMRNVNILSHSFGEDVVKRIIEHTATQMQEKYGYTMEDTKDILGQVLHISYGPKKNENNYTTNFEFKSFSDEEFGKAYKAEYIKDINAQIPYLGCGELSLKNNTLTLYAESFVGKKEDYTDHLIQTVRRDDNWTVENHRADTISKCLALTLAMGVLNSKENKKRKQFVPLPNAEDIKDLIQPVLDRENKSFFELKQREIWQQKMEERLKNQIDFNELLELNNITEKQLVNGKVKINDIIKNASSIKYPNNFIQDVFDKQILIDNNLSGKVLSLDEMKSKNLKYSVKGMILKNGICALGGEDENDAINLKCNQQNLDNSIRYSLKRFKDSYKNKLIIKKGFDFENKEYSTINELKDSVVSNVENMQLTAQQTRVICNLLSASKTPFTGLELEEGLELNESVINNEISINEYEQVNSVSTKKNESQMNK